ncbi:MAG: tol-pal system protein YbgF [Rhodocyclaceae bacterium]|nr:tol-pal system protein YbgF [Rhodocyclaceae bacterium]
MRRSLLPWLVAASFAAAPASAWAIFGDGDAHRRIDEQAKALQALADQVKALAESTARVQSLESRLGAFENTVNGGTLLNLLNQIETLNAEIAKLRGQLETANNRIEAADRRARDLYMDADGRLRALETPAPSATPSVSAHSPAEAGASAHGQAADAPAAAAAPPLGAAAAPTNAAAPAGAPKAPAAASAPPVAPPQSFMPRPSATGAVAPARPGSASDFVNESVAYEAAHAARKEGRFNDAVRLFQQFIVTHPASALAAPAQYWVGDSLYNAKDYAGAILAQRRLIDTYPGSAKVPDAMLNMASALRESGDVASERRTLEQLIAKFPASEAAEKARKRLATRN